MNFKEKEYDKDQINWIRSKAYELYIIAGKPQNRTLDFWLLAERKFLEEFHYIIPKKLSYDMDIKGAGLLSSYERDVKAVSKIIKRKTI